MIVLGAIIAIAGCWVASQSMEGGQIGLSLMAIGLTLVIVGAWK